MSTRSKPDETLPGDLFVLAKACQQLCQQDNIYELLRLLGQQAATLMDAPYAVAGLIEDGRLIFREAYQSGSWAAAEPACDKDTYWSLITGQNAFFQRDDLQLVPLSGHTGVIGVLEVKGARQSIDRLGLLGACVGPAIENLLMRQERRHRRTHTGNLNRLSQAITGKLELADLLATISDIMLRCIDATYCFLYLLSENQQELVCVSGSGWEVEEHRIRLDETSLAAQAVKTLAPVIAENVPEDPRRHETLTRTFDEKSLLAIPLVREGTAIGAAVIADACRFRLFTDEELSTVSQLADQAAIAIENARLFKVARSKIEASESTRSQLEAVLCSVPVGLAVFDRGDRLILENSIFKRMFGLPATTDLIGLPLETIVDMIQERHLFPKLAARIHSPHQTVPCEFELVNPQRWYRVSASPFYAGGVVAGHVLCYADITKDREIERRIGKTVAERTSELKASKDQLEAAIQDLQRLDRTKANFLNAVSHDLRTPLAAIMGYTEFLQEELEGPLSERQHQFVKNIMVGTEQLLRLLDDLLDYARLEAGTFKLLCMTTDYAHLIERASCNVSALCLEKKVDFEWEPTELPPVHADPDRVIQILNNLLSNAVKFTPEGGRITIRVEEKEGKLVTEIEDTGIGIPQEDIPKVFDRFYQVETAQSWRKKGVGLGLAIVKQLVEAHGGTIEVESHPGKGSIFRFSLPLA